MGSPNEFGWLFAVNVTFHQQATEIWGEIPLRLKASRFCLFAYAQPAKVRLRSG